MKCVVHYKRLPLSELLFLIVVLEMEEIKNLLLSINNIVITEAIHFVTSDIHAETNIETQPTLSPLGVITATLVGLLLSSPGSVHKVTHVVNYRDIVQWTAITILLIIAVPLFAILFLYRSCVHFIVRMKSPAFISLMDGPDVVWNMKDPSEPIITILAEIEAFNGSYSLLQTIREVVMKAVLSHPKLSWNRRYSSLGFSYWEMCTDIASLKDNVRWMEHSKKDRDYITPPELQSLISDISSHKLRNSSCWEILVSQKYLLKDRKEFQREVYPVLFRIHHSLGDGVSLLNILLKSLSTSLSNSRENCAPNCYEESLVEEKQNNGEDDSKRKCDELLSHRHVGEKSTQTDSGNRNQRGVIELFVSGGKVKVISDEIRYHSNAKLFTKYTHSFIHFFSQTSRIFRRKAIIRQINLLLNSLNVVRRTCQKSVLDSKALSGKKIIAWYSDSTQGSLFSSIKCIKSHNRGVRFTDVLLTVLSSSLEKHLKRKNQNIPKCVSVVVPTYAMIDSNITTALRGYFTDSTASSQKNVRVPTLNKEHSVSRNGKLQNSFSLGVLNLPVDIKGKVPRLYQVAHNMNTMHGSGQFIFNSFLIKWIAKVLPEPLLSVLFNIAPHNTVVVSNLIGPGDSLLFAGYPMKNICFWVPHRGNTGVSVSILSYCNRLQLGIMVDTSIIGSVEEVQCILHDIVSDVMHHTDKVTHDGPTR